MGTIRHFSLIKHRKKLLTFLNIHHLMRFSIENNAKKIISWKKKSIFALFTDKIFLYFPEIDVE